MTRTEAIEQPSPSRARAKAASSDEDTGAAAQLLAEHQADEDGAPEAAIEAEAEAEAAASHPMRFADLPDVHLPRGGEDPLFRDGFLTRAGGDDPPAAAATKPAAASATPAAASATPAVASATPAAAAASNVAPTPVGSAAPKPIGNLAPQAPVVAAAAAAAGHAAAAPAAAVDRNASVYKSAAQLKAMTLDDFDKYAKKQADWAISPTLGNDKEGLRTLLAFARKDKGLILGACRALSVQVLVDAKFGASNHDVNLLAYSRAIPSNRSVNGIRVEKLTASPSLACDWGEAILALEKGIPPLILQRVLPQTAAAPKLAELADEDNEGAVADLVKYFKDAAPLLDASNGKEIDSFLAFRGEGGMGKLATYKAKLPEIRNFHRFTVEQLDALVANREAAKGNAAKAAPLPVCVVLQTSFDHNGAFHRDPKLTAVIKRVTHLTLVAEGRNTLDKLALELSALAKFGGGGKVDEVMLSGHGGSKSMDLAGNKRVDRDDGGQEIYGIESNERLVAGKGPADRPATPDDTAGTGFLVMVLRQVLRDDPNARVVLNACLTASNSVENPNLDADPVKAAEQIRKAIKDNPSLATELQTKLGLQHRARVLGANSSCSSEAGLLDAAGRINLISAEDPQMTGSKIEYLKSGVEPHGVLLAAVECWGDDRAAAIAAIDQRLLATAADKMWRGKLIHTLLDVVAKNKDNAQLLNQLAHTASVLTQMKVANNCTLAVLRKANIPAAHADAIFTGLSASFLWTQADSRYVPVVMLQYWASLNAAKVADLSAALDRSGFTLLQRKHLDVALIKQLLPGLLPAAAAGPAPRGALLAALLCLAEEEDDAPDAAKAYVRAVVGQGRYEFPADSHGSELLANEDEEEVLEHAGIKRPVVAAAAAPAPAAPRAAAAPAAGAGAGAQSFNLTPTGAGNNTLSITPLTEKRRTRRLFSSNAYMLPAGAKIGEVPRNTPVHVIGRVQGMMKGTFSDTANAGYLAVEYAAIAPYKTVFVEESTLEPV